MVPRDFAGIVEYIDERMARLRKRMNISEGSGGLYVTVCLSREKAEDARN